MGKKRIVVKIGSSSLTNEQGEIDQQKLTGHIDSLAALRQANHEVILVTSGAVSAGFRGLGYSSRPVTHKGKQAAAAIGQSLLIQTYMDKFSAYNLTPAQILLTRSDFSDRDRYKNAFATITELLERGIIPVINENDTVSVEELTFGDNDMLSALVSGFIHADQLIILTDINGVYDSNPRQNPHAKKLDFTEKITPEMMAAADNMGSKVGTGGMKSKLLAAEIANSLDVPVFIGNGNGTDKFLDVLDGNGDGTYIANSSIGSITTKRQWIALHSRPTGEIRVDKGAAEAILFHGKSLLPTGISQMTGTFHKGDVVKVYNSDELLGKGVVRCSSSELNEAISHRESNPPMCKVSSIEVIHRDDWVQAENFREGFL